MAGAEGEGGPSPALVLDTNTVISALIRGEGPTRRIILLAARKYPAYTVPQLLEEIERHSGFLEEKKGIPRVKLMVLLDMLLADVETMEPGEEALAEALYYTRDPGDKHFVALALELRRRYREVVILTYNKRDYLGEELSGKGIRVMAPPEFAVEYL